MSRATLERDVAALAARLREPERLPTAVELAAQAGITPDPWQVEVLSATAPRLLLNCSRQSGKSTIVATLGVHQAIAAPDSLVLLVSPTLRQSGELFRKALAVYRAAARPVPATSESALSLGLANGSRIVSLPGKEGTIRGYSGVTLLAIDEASRVPDDLYAALRPMLAVSGGRLVAMSTPWGTRGWWYEAWRGAEAWQRWEIPAVRCPRISPTFLEEERRTMGHFWFAQEYGCEFLDAETAAFARRDIDAAFVPEVEQWEL